MAHAVTPMEESFFDAATERDTDFVDTFFADIYVGPHEPNQVYKVYDEDTNDFVDAHIVRGNVLAHVCSDNVPVDGPIIRTNSGTQEYLPYPVSIQFPATGTERIEVVQFVIDNIDRTFVDVLRRLVYPMKINIARGFVSSNPERTRGICTTMEQRLSHLSLVDVTMTAETIVGQLIVDNVMWKKHPDNNELYQHHNFPGLWGLDADDLP